jgi:hypothetical protein
MKSFSYVQVEAVYSEAVASEAVLKGRQRLANTSRWYQGMPRLTPRLARPGLDSAMIYDML